MASDRRARSGTPAHRGQHGKQPKGGPVLAIASVVTGGVGLLSGYLFSWMASVALGIVAVVLGIMAHRKQASPGWLAIAGIVLGGACLAASIIRVAIVSFQMIRLGLV